MKLIHGIFGSNRHPQFQLAVGQMRTGYSVVHNGSWFNRDGVKLGWGDLAPADFARIQTQLDPDDVFIVAREHDSFWDAGEKGFDVNNLPPYYVAEIARYAITKHEVLAFRSRYDSHVKVGDVTNVNVHGGSPCFALWQDRARLRALMGLGCENSFPTREENAERLAAEARARR